MLLQPFLPLVPELGEICLVFVRGGFVNAVHKDPAGWGSRRDGSAAAGSGGSDSSGSLPEDESRLGEWDVPGWF